MDPQQLVQQSIADLQALKRSLSQQHYGNGNGNGNGAAPRQIMAPPLRPPSAAAAARSNPASVAKPAVIRLPDGKFGRAAPAAAATRARILRFRSINNFEEARKALLKVENEDDLDKLLKHIPPRKHQLAAQVEQLGMQQIEALRCGYGLDDNDLVQTGAFDADELPLPTPPPVARPRSILKPPAAGAARRKLPPPPPPPRRDEDDDDYLDDYDDEFDAPPGGASAPPLPSRYHHLPPPQAQQHPPLQSQSQPNAAQLAQFQHQQQLQQQQLYQQQQQYAQQQGAAIASNYATQNYGGGVGNGAPSPYPPQGVSSRIQIEQLEDDSRQRSRPQIEYQQQQQQQQQNGGQRHV